MAIKSEIDKTNKQVIEPTFPALYAWDLSGDSVYGEIHLFIAQTTSIIISGVNVGLYSCNRYDCNSSCWRRLGIGERIFLENSD